MQIDFLRDAIGRDAAQACSVLLPHIEGVMAVALAKYTPPPPVQARAKLTAEELEIANKAAVLRRTNWFSFLSILLEQAAKAHIVADGLLDAVNYHQKHAHDRVWLGCEDAFLDHLQAVELSGSNTSQIALCSKVRTREEGVFHIPMLDFHVEKTTISFELVERITRKLFGDDFIILATNRSFHSLGLVLKRESEFMRILANSILFTPLVDNAYVAHQLMEQEATLRIGKDIASGTCPRVIAASNNLKLLIVSDIDSVHPDVMEREPSRYE